MNWAETRELCNQCKVAVKEYFAAKTAPAIDRIIDSNKPMYEMVYKEECSACMRMIYSNLPPISRIITGICEKIPATGYPAKLDAHMETLRKALPTYEYEILQAMANAAASAEIRQIHELTSSEVKNEFYYQCREYVATKLPRW